MATVYTNLSYVGSAGVGGKQATVVSRGSGAAGAVTIAFDTTKVTLKSQILQAVNDIIPTLLDQLK